MSTLTLICTADGVAYRKVGPEGLRQAGATSRRRIQGFHVARSGPESDDMLCKHDALQIHLEIGKGQATGLPRTQVLQVMLHM